MKDSSAGRRLDVDFGGKSEGGSGVNLTVII